MNEDRRKHPMNLSIKIQGLRELLHFDNRWELILSRALQPRKKKLLYRYKGLEFLSDHAAGDANGARSILVGDMYRKFLREMRLPPKLNVADIGANNGGFPLLLASEGFSFDQLVAVELSPTTYVRLRENLSRNFDESVEVINAAVCGERRDISFKPGGSSTSDSIFQDLSADGNCLQTVSGVTLSDVLARFEAGSVVDLCKIDIEGAEFEIFSHPDAFRGLRRCRYLLIEIHHTRGRDRNEIRSALIQEGFEEVGKPADDELHHVHLFRNARIAPPEREETN